VNRRRMPGVRRRRRDRMGMERVDFKKLKSYYWLVDVGRREVMEGFWGLGVSDGGVWRFGFRI
jgi:hypothetical protein